MQTRFEKFVMLLPVALSLLLIIAHFLHNKLSWFASIYFLLFIVFLFFREEAIVKVLQASLLVAGCEWLRTVFVLVSLRMQEGGSWIRLAFILIGVASFTFASIFVFRTKALREVYGVKKTE